MFNLLKRFYFILLAAILLPMGVAQAEEVVIRKSSYPIPAASRDFRYIRVYLQGGVREFNFKTYAPLTITDKLNRPLLKAERLPYGKIKPAADGILLNGQLLRSIPIQIESHGDGFHVGGNTYRDILQIWVEKDGTLLIVNEIPIEDYLKGVLPSEMSAEWSLEALKAQAVASRTYALFKMIENRNNHYDLTKDVLTQVYKGRSLEHKLSTRAVRETQGQILSYQGKVILSFFHSTCGGHTANIADLWDMEEHPSLKGVECGFCRFSRHYHWSSEVPTADMEKRLKAKGYSIFGIQNIQLENRDEGGRYRTVTVTDSKGRKKFKASDFRFMAGPDKIKSTLIDKIEQRGKKFYIQGRGWGHGAGLCQYGARRLSELGYIYKQILKFYYPGTDIHQFWEQNQFL